MMITTMISHACLVIESRGTTLLTDPIFFDYLWEECNVQCPSIDLDLAKLPKVDILNISHRHQDHFDIRTLAYLAGDAGILAPDAVVLAPRDEILLEVLEKLEFKNITVVEDFKALEIKGLTLTPTPSLNKQDYFPEHGLLVHDGEVTLWNQVDTIVSPDMIKYMHRLYGQLDFAHVRYLPLLEGNFSFHLPLELPMEEYDSFLKVAAATRPKFAVPGSAGFKYRDEFGFLNQYSFPTTQEQFLRDLADFCPEIKTSVFYPSDRAVITPGGVEMQKAASEFVKIRVNDGHKVEFKPVAEVPPIRTRTQDKAQHEKEWQAVVDFIENRFVDLLVEKKAVRSWVDWKVVYQLEVFGQDGSEIWCLDFAGEDAAIIKGRVGKINLYEGIACSELYSLIQNETSWDYVGINGQYRTFKNIYRIRMGEFEHWTRTDDEFLQPLTEVFPAGAEMDREKFMRDVERWKGKV
ncbi:MAG: MBL fold metallo-hydrolase [Nitrospina sp.]|nr:MBL fold metallo-hydrolase [Nitrospina sp.]MBT3413706.1 MBL fold metallo-hydrolase [Nitrospina sp.]MBT3856694.1 MBL fold metallo-hydrolase [Nitrospina sp.]MBT4105311.1 MBL fold metallo-hydrolase [Nitrospina sp.]MBT5259995.1 MBL fold metallo-hydrolase [Nitrospina sp.]